MKVKPTSHPWSRHLLHVGQKVLETGIQLDTQTSTNKISNTGGKTVLDLKTSIFLTGHRFRQLSPHCPRTRDCFC